MPDWITESGTMVLSEAQPPVANIQQWIAESYADLESLYREDVGWQKIGLSGEQFSTNGLKAIRDLARVMCTANPILKRGLSLRAAYVWGAGVTVQINDDGEEGQDVNAVWQAFWDHPMNQQTFSGAQAQEELEWALGTDGERFRAFPTNQLTGQVQVRTIEPDEITDRICNPQDAADVWYYRRDWNAVVFDAQGTKQTEKKTTLYPALGYYPTIRPKRIRVNKQDCDVRWDAPMLHTRVNKPTGPNQWRGLGDVFPALPWARLDKEFLEDWALLMKALSSIAFQVKTRASKAASAARQVASRAAVAGNPQGAGATVGMDPNSSIEAVPKTGATIDAESHRPLASYVAAGLGLPLTMLLGDTGGAGANRSVAETLDQPNELDKKMRRNVHASDIRRIADYVIDQAVVAPRGPLRGAVARDGDRLVVTLPEGDSRQVEVSWPEFDSTPVDILVKAIVAADQTEKVPPLEIFKLLAKALGIENFDELIEDLTDDQGRWIPQDVRDDQVRGELADRGEDGADLNVPDEPTEPDPDGND